MNTNPPESFGAFSAPNPTPQVSEPFAPDCRIFSIQKIAHRDPALRQRGLFVKADELRRLVATALCYPHQPTTSPIGGWS